MEAGIQMQAKWHLEVPPQRALHRPDVTSPADSAQHISPLLLLFALWGNHAPCELLDVSFFGLFFFPINEDLVVLFFLFYKLFIY